MKMEPMVLMSIFAIQKNSCDTGFDNGHPMELIPIWGS